MKILPLLALSVALPLSTPHALAQSSFGSSSAAPAVVTSPTTQADITISDRSSCPTPKDIAGGEITWTVENTSNIAVNIYIADEKDSAYQVLERIGSPSTRKWTVKLQDGTYHLQCVFNSRNSISSGSFTVAGSPWSGIQGFTPITNREISDVSIAHENVQKSQLPRLLEAADNLLNAVKTLDRATAQAAYLKYLETYRFFDDNSEDLPGGDLSGYSEIEKLLWSDAPVSDSLELAANLDSEVQAVLQAIKTANISIAPPDYGLRTHEVMEEFERFDLRGERDFGAHALPTALHANVATTRGTLDPLKSLVESHGLDTAPIYAQLAELDALATEFQGKYGQKLAFADWPQQDQERLEGAIARINELLAPVATMTVIRRM